MNVGIRWNRDIPNELLYLPICSYVLNNPNAPFYIECPSQVACTLMKCFIERLQLEPNIRNCIHIVNRNSDILKEHNIIYLSPNTIFLKKLETLLPSTAHPHAQPHAQPLFNIIKLQLFTESEKKLYLQQLNYVIEENNTDLLQWEEDKWDLFYYAYEDNVIMSYFWKNYVCPFLPERQHSCFSFCLYGTNDKYLQGFINNIILAKQYFPTFSIILWMRSDSTPHILPKIQNLIDDRLLIFEIIDESQICMMRYRIFSINHWYPVAIYSRDADSRLGERDRICIEIFQKSGKSFHIIRDHYWHKSRVMGGTCGVCRKNGILPSFNKLFNDWAKKNTVHNYATDEKFLEEVVYSYFKEHNELFIQSNIIAYNDEVVYPICHKLNAESTDFIGNCYSALDFPEFKYWDFPIENHLAWLKMHTANIPINEHCFTELTDNPIISRQILRDKDLLSRLIRNKIYEENLVQARQLFSEFEWIPTVDENVLRTLVVPYFDKFQKSGGRVILTTDISRKMDDENTAIIIIGNYPYGVWNLPCQGLNPLHFPVMFYNLIQGPRVTWEYDACWEPIKKIYVLNLQERIDRWVATLGELVQMGAPLNRIHHYKAMKAEPATKLEIYWGATKNHVDCVKDFVESGEEYCLVLEDDIQFCSDTARCKKELTNFFKRQYDFDICMISYSKMGLIEPVDDCVLISKQACTTSSGYILRKETATKIYQILDEGLCKMRETGDYITYCCDRYWAKIQGERKFLLLRNKIAYQRVVYSNITGCNNLFLD